MNGIESQQNDGLIADLNAALKRSGENVREATLADLPRFTCHFSQWSVLQGGQLIKPEERIEPLVTPAQILAAVRFLEIHGSTLALHPGPMRKLEAATFALENGISVATLHDIWSWWSTAGRSLLAK